LSQSVGVHIRVNRTGWWLLIGFVPLVGLIVLIVFLVQPSMEGDNQYGSIPVVA